jgi:hypothetical protein
MVSNLIGFTYLYHIIHTMSEEKWCQFLIELIFVTKDTCVMQKRQYVITVSAVSRPIRIFVLPVEVKKDYIDGCGQPQ